MPIERRPNQRGEGQQPFGGGKNAPQPDERPVHGPPQADSRNRVGNPSQLAPVPLEEQGDLGSENNPQPAAERERLKQALQNRWNAVNSGEADSLGGPFTDLEWSVLNDVAYESRRADVQANRIERRRLKSMLGKQEFNRRRRRHELDDIY